MANALGQHSLVVVVTYDSDDELCRTTSRQRMTAAATAAAAAITTEARKIRKCRPIETDKERSLWTGHFPYCRFKIRYDHD